MMLSFVQNCEDKEEGGGQRYGGEKIKMDDGNVRFEQEKSIMGQKEMRKLGELGSIGVDMGFRENGVGLTKDLEMRNSGWKAVGSQAAKMNMENGFVDSIEGAGIWGVEELAEKAKRLNLNDGEGFPGMKTVAGRGGALGVGGMVVVGGNRMMEKSGRRGEGWVGFSHGVESEGYGSGDMGMYNVVGKSRDVGIISGMAQHVNEAPADNVKLVRSGNGTLKEAKLAAEAAAAAEEAVFMDSVMMSAMDLRDSGGHGISGGKAAGMMFPQGTGQTPPKQTVGARRSTFDVYDLDLSAAHRPKAGPGAAHEALFDKPGLPVGMGGVSLGNRGAGTNIQPLDLVTNGGAQHISITDRLRYQNAIPTAGYYDPSLESSFNQNMQNMGMNPTPMSVGMGGLGPGYSLFGRTQQSFMGPSDPLSTDFSRPPYGPPLGGYSSLGFAQPSFNDDGSFGFAQHRRASQPQKTLSSLKVPHGALSHTMPSAFAVQPQLRQPSYSIGHVNVPLNTPVSIQQSTNGKIHSHSVQNIPPPIQLSEMGKGVPLVSLPKNARIFVVQFKGTRSDVFFYNPDSSAPPSEPVLRPGVCVILEADRGQDLGLIIEEYRSRDQVVSFMSSHEHISESCALNADVSGAVFSKASGSDSSSTPSSLSPSPSPTPGSPSAPIKPSTPPSLDSTPCPPQPDSDPAPSVSLKDIYIKRIFRVADQSDIEQVNSKIADEQKALLVCQSKVRQKKLPMEVCDAEFQWDRRKLTFYFIADRRIDFRELVRELFKTYKTRIWMCAVDQKQQQQQQQQSL